MKKLLLATLFLTFATPSFAAEVTLTWDPVVPAPDGYRLFQRADGQSYDYSSPVWEGTEQVATLPGLPDDSQLYWVVRAYVGNMESANSNEVGLDTSVPVDMPDIPGGLRPTSMTIINRGVINFYNP